MDIKFWTRALREAEAELEAATTRTALNAAAKRLMRARAELKEAGAAEPTRPATDAVTSNGSSRANEAVECEAMGTPTGTRVDQIGGRQSLLTERVRCFSGSQPPIDRPTSSSERTACS